ncbi:hypothetical protein ABZ357_34435 [Streptomyces sp. NPDC005917]|uniref:hypothetical protein n=1 Tax=unclassified Streptomyces TaxID=2593676 RepID=UPI0033F7DBE6
MSGRHHGQPPGSPVPPRSHRTTPKAMPMNGSRIPGLLVPAVFLLALVAGLFWYWRHRDDD